MEFNYDTNLIPVGDRVLLRKKVESETTTNSGIILVNPAEEDSNSVLEVVAVGPDVKINIKPGDYVMCNSTMGLKIKNNQNTENDNYQYLFITPPHIFAVVTV